MEIEEEIRKPDAVIIDRLFSSDSSRPSISDSSRPSISDLSRPSISDSSRPISDSEYDIKRILEESEAEFEFQFAILESQRMAKEREERAAHFAGFLSKIKRFAKIDKSNESFYLKLIEYIELYEREGVEIVNVSRDFYMKFTRTMDNMRINPEEKSRLYQLIRL